MYSSNFHKHQKKKLLSSLRHTEKLILGASFLTVFGEVALSNHVKVFVFLTSADKKKLMLYLEPFKNWFLGGEFGGPWGDGTPKVCQNICHFNIY